MMIRKEMFSKKRNGRIIAIVVFLLVSRTVFCQPESSLLGKQEVADLQHFPIGFTPQEVGNRLAWHFTKGDHFLHDGKWIHYAEVCTWLGALRYARLAGNRALIDSLEKRFTKLVDEESYLLPVKNHVDLNMFGSLPLELYQITHCPQYKNIGLSYADTQWKVPDDADTKARRYAAKGFSWQTRLWIDDMFMITIIQSQAYRATGNREYIDRAAREMVFYLNKLQQPNGLFFHASDAPFYWARGNGWMAAGMTELLKALPERSQERKAIFMGYCKMMKALRDMQSENGMWNQLVDQPDCWPETSGSAMFAYALITGVKRGWLNDKEYATSARKAWLALVPYINKDDDVTEVCVGTNKKNDRQYYFDRPRIVGDYHGQAPYLWCVAALMEPTGVAETNTIHVSPQGSDFMGTGSIENPYQSISKALENRMHQPSADTLYISVASGDYYLADPIIIKHTMRPIVIRGDKDNQPRLMGGVMVADWQPCGEGCYRARLPQVVRYGTPFEQFYVNGRRATLARTPNEGWYYVESSKEFPMAEGKPLVSYAVQQIDLHPADWQSLQGATAEELQDMKFRFYHKWDITRKSPRHILPDSARIYMDGLGMKPWNPIGRRTRYFMYNYRRALDTPGEWYCNRNEGYIYYMPLQGEDMAKAYCIIPVLQHWLQIEGSLSEPIGNIIIEGLSFQYSSYTIPPMGEEPMQAAASSDAAIRMDNADHVILRQCEMMHTGAYALWIGENCHYNTVEQCYLADLGAGGIKVGEPWYPEPRSNITSHNVIDNNIITSAGKEQPCGVGIALFHTAHNRVSHNDVFDILYSGISVGWVWGYGESPAKGNEILYNHIHHIGWGELSDMGAVYTLGPSEGTRVCYNYIHDVWTYDYGGWGLYTDEGSTGIELSHNIVVRCKSGGFHQHYGKGNIVENNILAYGYLHQAQLTRAEQHQSFRFKHNILLYDHGESLAREAWSKAVVDIDSNLYWRTDFLPVMVQGQPFAQWKKEREPHSIEANPFMRNPKADDFTFTSLRQVRRIGFVPSDAAQKAGVYGDEEWRSRARLSPERDFLFRSIWGESVRLMSYNIRNCEGMDQRCDYRRVAAIIAQEAPDIVALQEVDSITQRSKGTYVAGYLARLTGLHATYAPAIPYDGGKYGVALLSRQKPESFYYVPLPGREEARTLLVVHFKDYVVMVTHLSLTKADQLASVSILENEARKAAASGKPVFLAGDFNSTSQSLVQQQMDKHFYRLTGTDWDTCNGECIDFIFCFKDDRTPVCPNSESRLIPDNIASDHRPIFVTCKLQ